ncbi:hypothetical protein ACFC0M_28130 [Streptomyces sp. NPDC056149]|uniref:hypothetical protein n=1 Tax=unclassified Streptomyces TaxID=2593676 RepID=UPI002380C6C9|nr:hypothetical protein [Streptomyces sp. WZ-12]
MSGSNAPIHGHQQADQEGEAVRRLAAGNVRIDKRDLPGGMRAEGYLLGICAALGFLLSGIGIKSIASPANHWAIGPFMLIPGLPLFIGAVLWGKNFRRRALTYVLNRQNFGGTSAAQQEK